MKKLLLLLPMALLMTVLISCNENEKTDYSDEVAKSMVGTYECSRGCYIYLINPSNNDTIRLPIRYHDSAVVTHLGGNRVQFDMGGFYTGSVSDCVSKNGGRLKLDPHTEYYQSEQMNFMFNTYFAEDIYTTVYDIVFIQLEETFSGSFHSPDGTYRITGGGYTTFSRSK